MGLIEGDSNNKINPKAYMTSEDVTELCNRLKALLDGYGNEGLARIVDYDSVRLVRY
jgi:hypothetical protein